MHISNHAVLRAQRRGIHPMLIELIIDEGVPLSRNQERLFLGKREIQRLREEGVVDRELLERAEKAAPLVLVLSGDTIVTIFRVKESINRSR